MRKIFNEITDGVILLDKNGEIKFCNKSLLQELGYIKSELENKNVSVILNGRVGKSILDIYNDRYVDFLDKEKMPKGYIITSTIKNIDGEELLVVIAKKNNNHLYSKEDLENFLYEAPMIVMLKGIDGKYYFANKAALKAFNIKDSIVGKTDEEIFGVTNIESDIIEDEKIISIGKAMTCKKIITRNEMIDCIEMIKIPIRNKEGQVKHIIKLAKDITLRTKLGDALSQSYEKLENINNILENDFESNNQKLDNIQNNLLHALGAEGLNLFIYDKEQEKLVSEFTVGVCRLFDELGYKEQKIDIEKFRGMKSKLERGIISLACEREHIQSINFLNEMGIKYQCTFSISFNEEPLGIINALYKEEKDIMSVDRNEVKNICDQIALLVKNNALAKELQRHLNQKLAAEEELEEFLNTAMDLLCLSKDNGRIVKINKEITSILGWTQEEWMSTNTKRFLHPDDYNLTVEEVKKSKSNPGVIHTVTNRQLHKNGTYQWLAWRFKYVKERDIIMATATNITHLKMLEETSMEYEKALQMESIKNEFFANISHEFKTPLNIILATMQLINRGIDNGDIEVKGNIKFNKYMKSIIQNSYRLLRLVNNLIDMTRIDTGFYKLNLENHNIRSIVEDITTSVAHYVEDKGITLIFDTDEEEKIIACDPDKIERIILNLLSNAIKYSDNKGDIEVNINTTKNDVCISVKDKGIGIPVHKQQTIFERFTQVDNTLTRRCEGSGIGLSLVKSLVELHDGNIKVVSEEGSGAEFIFTLPLRLVNSELKSSKNNLNSKIEKCNIEFSDIYTL